MLYDHASQDTWLADVSEFFFVVFLRSGAGDGGGSYLFSEKRGLSEEDVMGGTRAGRVSAGS